jgi:hypothetical protein
VHVIYAVPADGEDHFSAIATPIVADLGALDAWWRREDPTRTPRFDLFAFPGCPSGLDGLDISSVRLPHEADYYRPIEERQGRLAGDLGAAFSDPGKKYLVYYDGAVAEPYDCGQSAVAPTTGDAAAYSFVYLQAESCTHDLGAGEGEAGYAAHELLHNLGAVPDAAPHVCFEHSVCDWYWDVEMQFPTGDPIAELILDYGRDDYYGHAGSWFDVQDSLWLVHVGAPLYKLTVATLGTGTGSVTSDAPGVSCPGSCAIAWEQGSNVALRATAAPGSRFLRWSGACTGSAECAVAMDAPKQVGATFAPAVVSVAVRVLGRGVVISSPPGITCPGRCRARYDSGTSIRLHARAHAGWRLKRWSPPCGPTLKCFISPEEDRLVTATFRPR